MSNMHVALWLAEDGVARNSVRVIHDGQAASGAYVASPSFSQYGYGWLRDGAFCALAMEAVGDAVSAARFHDWVTTTVLRHKDMFVASTASLLAGEVPAMSSLPPTRYQLDGTLEPAHAEAWPNFQLDGYGTWLCALASSGLATDSTRTAVRLVADLLAASWAHPCFDCWEEGGDQVHGSTLVAVAGGLLAAAQMLGDDGIAAVAAEVIDRIGRDFVLDGSLCKLAGDDRVDASLAWAAVPHGTFASDDPLVLRTVDRIVEDLGAPGIRRYLGDSYFGGGDWVLLTGLVAWQDAMAGRRDRWASAMQWMRGTATAEGWLPEQTLDRVQFPDFIEPWEQRWGTVATPLLWSHAMYLLAGAQGARNAWSF